jgi:hypothetical protein
MPGCPAVLPASHRPPSGHYTLVAHCVLTAACNLPPICCFACSIDYPVKWFVVVVGEQAAAGKNAIAYEVKHLLQYPQDKVGESCCRRTVQDLSCSCTALGSCSDREPLLLAEAPQQLQRNMLVLHNRGEQA